MRASTKLRILMTTDAVGGVWIYAGALARALCAGGNEVRLVVMGPAPQPEQLAPLSGVPGLTVVVSDLQLEWIDPQGADLPHARETLRHIADGFAPDLVHLNSFREASFDWPVPVLVVAHSCVWTWWRACRGCDPDEPRWRVYADNVAAGLATADAWVAPTAAFRHEVATLYRPPRDGVVIRNGVTAHSVSAIAKQPCILAAGRLWDEAKNICVLADLAAELAWPLRIGGSLQGPESPAPQMQITKKRAAYLGSLPHDALLGEMDRAAIFVSPALYEPFGLSVLEAAANGCALVLSDLPSFRELWGEAACFVTPRDREALCKAVQMLCGDQKRRSSLQAAARARAQLHSLAAMTRAYQDLYGAILSAPAGAAMTSACSMPELRA